MDGPRLRLTGIGEGFSTQIRTTLSGADSPRRVLEAVQSLFPDIEHEPEEEPCFGKPTSLTWTFEDISLGPFLQLLHEQRILDTALDAMSMSLTDKSTSFYVSRLAALAGKIAFPIPGDEPLGGVVQVSISGDGLDDWLQAATWHAGRSQIPRHIKDEHGMDEDGESTTWV